MLKALKKIVFVVIVLVGLFAILVAFQPSQYRVERSATVAAPAAVVFRQVNDFHNWQAWSPWAKLDPAAKNTFEGPASGAGAVFTWAGNGKVGEGRMTIVESRPNELIRIKLEFVKPFVSTGITEYTFKPSGEQTAVTWAMSGENNFMAKAVCMFMNMDKTLGGQFEQGLAQMKAVAEAAAAKKQ